ncbi:MAG TPA: GGDEF and EAL domain-containing protein [Nitrospiria bacterium]
MKSVLFRSIRHFTIASIVIISVATSVLGLIYREIVVKEIVAVEESKNVALSQAFANSLWSNFTPFIASANKLSRAELQTHPESTRLHKALEEQVKGLSVIKVKIYNHDGRTLFSTEKSQIGEVTVTNPGFISAKNGKIISHLTRSGELYTFEGTVTDRSVLTSYVPVRGGGPDGAVESVFELYSDVTPMIRHVARIQRNIFIGASTVLVVFLLMAQFTRRALRLHEKECARMEKTLERQAIRDPHTELYNRRYFDFRIKEAMVLAGRNQQSLALLLCDLDQFKSLNDLHGHEFCDKILKVLAERMGRTARAIDLVFRWGGDEFMILLPSTEPEGALGAAKRIRKAAQNVGEEFGVPLDFSIGVALYPQHGSALDSLLRILDRALYIAKKGGDRVHVGDEEYHLDENTIKAVFQPIVDLRTNRLIGHEALSRDPRGLLSIIDLFTRYQSIGQLEELKSLCFRSQLKKAHELGHRRIFLNVDFKLLKAVRRIPMPPGLEVILEISELEAMHDLDEHLGIVRSWREMGYQFAMDDFGSGFVSLPFIAKALPEYIKLDRSTVQQAVTSEKFKNFMEHLVRALRNYSTGIVAEGIETQEELATVKDMGIFMAQGYLLGRPMEEVSQKALEHIPHRPFESESDSED